MTDDAGAASTRLPRACPICGKPAVPDFLPFCSKRCADIDLHRWLSGAYAIPGTDEVSDEEREGGTEKRLPPAEPP